MQPLLFTILMYTPTKYRNLVDEYLAAKSYGREPKELYEPVQYVLALGGKRIRPILMLMAYHMLREDVESILPVAIGLETYHNYTLVHDDIMDNADLRRGKATVHVKWNQQQPMDSFVSRLNRFEKFNIIIDNNTIIIQ